MSQVIEVKRDGSGRQYFTKGFELIAVGERRATPTELSTKRFPDPERVKLRSLM